MKRIELPSNELAQDLQKHLQQKRFPSGAFDKGRREVQFPDETKESEWLNVKAEAEKWAKAKSLVVTEVLKLQFHRTEQVQTRVEPKTEPKTEPKIEPEELKAELKRRLDSYTPEKAEERYRYLSSKPITDLSDAEYNERIALAQRPSKKAKAPKE